MFHRVVARGYTLVYEPSALVWHTHRRDPGAFRRLVFNNGTSFGAYSNVCAASVGRPSGIASFLLRDG